MALTSATDSSAVATAEPESSPSPLPVAAPQPALWRRLAPFAVAALGGVPMGYSWLNPGFPLGAWVGMFVLAALTVGRPAAVAFRRGIVFGMVAITLAFHWVPEVTSIQLSVSYPTATVLFILAAACDAFHFALAVYLAARLANQKVWASLLFPLCFIGLEFLWIRIFPWRLAHSQIAWESFIQIAEFTGVYGVGFVMAWAIAVAAIGLNQCVARYQGREPLCQVGRWEALTCLLVVASSIAFGMWRIGNIEALAQAQPPVKVGLVQTNVWKKEARETLRELTNRVASEVDLVCWPESSVGTYSLSLKDFCSLEKITELSHVKQSQVPIRPWENPSRPLLCVGKSYPDGTPDAGPLYVSAFLIDRQEHIAGLYHKRSLLPLGEYVPGDHWFPKLAEFALLEETIMRGTDAGIIELPGQAKIGTLICYEDMVEGNARQSVRAGADLLVTLANGASFGETHAMPQHQQLAYFRAIENRRYFLRCATTGSTSVISPTGKLVAQLPLHEDATLVATVYPLHVATFYTYFGNVFAYLCLGAMVVLGIWRWRNDRLKP